MKLVWSQFIGIFTVALLAGGAVTGAYFNDTEGSTMNLLSAFKLDAEVIGESFEDNICATESSITRTSTFENVGGLDFEYEVMAGDFAGELCGVLEVRVLHGETEIYNGPLESFDLGLFELAYGESDEWEFELSVLSGTADQDVYGKSCTFETRYYANQQEFLTGEAFYDVESIAHTVTCNEASCTLTGPTVNLRMNKHISGDDIGFSESEFSFHITGNGIDTVVPHDGMTALPVGTYSIEELVPEGFVKEDWRIGWYGTCERGSDFSTTITINDGNVDHGAIDCQADNQYRPELNKGTEEVNEEPVIEESIEPQAEDEEEEVEETQTRPDRNDRDRTSRRSDEDEEELVETESVTEVEELETEDENPTDSEDSEDSSNTE